jgi:cell division protein FtsB
MAKKKGKNRFKLKHLIFCFLFLYVSLIFVNQRKLMKELEVKRLDKALEVEKLEKEIDGLNKEIKNSDSLEFVEKIARDDLGMVKPREIIYIDKNRDTNPFRTFKKK